MASGEVTSLFKIPPIPLHRRCRPNLFKGMLVIVIFLLLFEFLHVTIIQQPRQWNSFFIFNANVQLCDKNDCSNTAANSSANQLTTTNYSTNYEIAINDTTTKYYSHPPPYIGRRNLTSGQLEKWCPASPPGMLGMVQLVMETVKEEDIIQANPALEPGGRFAPKDCTARQTVAIIIPYRNRPEHLSIFLNNIHRILQRQQLDYAIFVVEQNGSIIFNRAALMNVGYLEAKKSYPYNCFIFHDVDLLPEDDRNLYSCPNAPRHMSVALDKFNYKIPYDNLFGGISALTDDQIEKINGFPNLYWGWGGEDDDISTRVRSNGYTISRYNDTRARYKMIKHGSDPLNPINPKRFDMVKTIRDRMKTDGLNSVRYTLIENQLRPLYTWLLVDVGAP